MAVGMIKSEFAFNYAATGDLAPPCAIGKSDDGTR